MRHSFLVLALMVPALASAVVELNITGMIDGSPLPGYTVRLTPESQTISLTPTGIDLTLELLEETSVSVSFRASITENDLPRVTFEENLAYGKKITEKCPKVPASLTFVATQDSGVGVADASVEGPQ